MAKQSCASGAFCPYKIIIIVTQKCVFVRHQIAFWWYFTGETCMNIFIMVSEVTTTKLASLSNKTPSITGGKIESQQGTIFGL